MESFRLRLFFVISCILFLILLSRFAYLQIYQYEYWKERSEENRIRVIPKTANRGIIYDRNNKVITNNKLSYSVVLYPLKINKKKVNELKTKIEKIVGIPCNNLENKLIRAGYNSPYPIYLLHNANDKVIAKVLENKSSLPGIEVIEDSIRYYPFKNVFSHVIGYCREITEDELKTSVNKDYKMGDIIGKIGLEQKFDIDLRGKNGGSYIEVDAYGKLIKVLKTELPKQGNSLQISLDIDIQIEASKALGNRKGAIVAMNPFTGEILAMVSKPDFDPNIFSEHVLETEWVKLLNSKNYPFCNRALSIYPPGSIFKIITSAAALEKGKLTRYRTFNSTGSMRIGNRIFYDWNKQGFGIVNIEEALAHSIDTVFYELGLELGIYPIKMYANLFNLGTITGIELPGELGGIIPDEIWKQQNLNEMWYPGDTANTSIGQGFIQMSPLQAAVMISAIANNGNIVQPFIVKYIKDSEGKIIKNCIPQKVRKLPISKNTIDIIKEGLEGAVNYGTAKALQIPGIQVAAKTGTAEDPPKKTHAWVVAYAPVNNPQIAVAVFLEHGGSGGKDAAPIAHKVILKALGLDKKDKDKDKNKNGNTN